MHRKFLNARSPLRLLEKGLHGGLGRGNLGLLLAGHGVGKTPFLVGVALDDLLRGERALHVALDQTVSHVRAYYDTVFEELATTTQLEDAARVHLEVDRRLPSSFSRGSRWSRPRGTRSKTSTPSPARSTPRSGSPWPAARSACAKSRRGCAASRISSRSCWRSSRLRGR